MLQFDLKERQLMVSAIDAGARFLGAYDRRLKPRPREIAAFKQVVASGQGVPAAALRLVCMGLEELWWNQSACPDGIPQLLAKLEPLCGYQRFGMLARLGGLQ